MNLFKGFYLENPLSFMSCNISYITKFLKAKGPVSISLGILCLCLSFIPQTNAQFVKAWDKFRGDTGFNELKEMYEVEDGFIVFGTANNYWMIPGPGLNDHPFTYGGTDFWMYKIDFDGNFVSGNVYGGDSSETLLDAIPTSDGGYLMGGFSNSGISGIKTEPNNSLGFGERDMWVVKVDANGVFQWDKTIGGDGDDYLSAVHQTPDGGYLLCGWVDSTISGDVSQASQGTFDYWVVKLDAAGDIDWEKRFGGSNVDIATDIIPMSDGNYLIIGQSSSDISGDRMATYFGSIDYWVLKIDPAGNLIWQRSYGGDRSEIPREGIVGPNGNYYIGGYTRSTQGTGNKLATNYGLRDYWMIELDNDGNKLLDITYGGAGDDDMNNIVLLNKGNIGLVGISDSNVSGTKDENTVFGDDYWLVIVDDDGTELFQESVGGTDDPVNGGGGSDQLFETIQQADGSLILGGLSTSFSPSGDVTDTRLGVQDNWIVKLECNLPNEFDLGLDTVICELEPITFDVTVPLECTYLWENGSTSPIRMVNPVDDTYYYVTISNALGCTASDSIFVRTKPIPDGELGPDRNLCVGDSILLDPNSTEDNYLWSTGETTPTIYVSQGGIYSVIINNDSLCSITEEITITLDPLPIIDIGPDITRLCEDASITLNTNHPGPDYLWSPNGETTPTITISDEGEYSVIVTDANGCSATDTTQLVFYTIPTIELGNDTTICLNQAVGFSAQILGCSTCDYLWNDGNMSAVRIESPGVDTEYSVIVTDANGCTITDTIEISVLPLPEVDLGADMDICVGESATLTFGLTGTGPFNVTYNNGVVDIPLTGISDGHTIMVMPSTTTTYTIVSIEDSSSPESCSGTTGEAITVLVNAPVTVSEPAAICEGDSLFVGDAWQLLPGTYSDTLQTYQGCDSIIMTVLEVNRIDTTRFTNTTCIPSEAGVVMDNELNVFGCDSIIVTTTVLLEKDTIRTSDTTCDAAMAGVDTTFLTNQFGCDSLIIETIDLLPSDTIDVPLTSCDPMDVGIDTIFLTNQFGCDSLLVETTTLLPTDIINQFNTTCDAAVAGIDTTFLTNQFGCDSIVINEVVLLPSDTLRFNLTSCDLSEIGIDTMFLMNQNGCDSLIINTTTSLPSDTLRFDLTSCDLADVGIDTTFLTNRFNCDSLIINTTTLLPSDTLELTATSCDPLDIGVDTTFLTNQFACDSLIIVTTTLLPSDTLELTAASCNPMDVGVDTTFLTNQFNCDSLVIVTTSLLPTDTIQLGSTTCIPGEEGIDTSFLTNQWMCDSIIIKTTVLLPSDTIYINQTSCFPNEIGIDTSFLTNQWMCDSLIITETTLVPDNTTFLDDTTCDPMEAGMDTLFLTNQFSCDSLVITNTVLLPTDSTYIEETTCDPDMEGTQEILETNQYGCDSTIFLTLNLVPSDTMYFDNTSCDPMDVGMDTIFLTNINTCDSLIITTTSLSLNDTTYTNAFNCDINEVGLDTTIFATTTCDSIVIQETFLLEKDTTELMLTTCDPMQVGTSTELLINQNGCDSLVISTTELLLSDTIRIDQTSCDPADMGIDTLFLTNQNNCDSLVIITVTFSMMDVTRFDEETCDPIMAGIDTVFMMNQFDCDSLIITTTNLLPLDTTYIDVTTCDPSAVGIETEIFPTDQCDSTVITTTILSTSQTTYVDLTTCDPQDVGMDTVVYNTPTCDSTVITSTILSNSQTTYIDLTTCNPLAVGIDTVVYNTPTCDSTVITSTILSNMQTTFVTATSCDPVALGVDTITYMTPTCDSMVITTTILATSDTTYINGMTCDPAEVIMETMTYPGQLCDSVVITNIALSDTDVTFIEIETCDPLELGIDTVTYNTPTCDSLVITTTIFAQSDTIYVERQTCDPNGAGIFSNYFINDNGCDSLIIETVVLVDEIEINLVEYVCDPADVDMITNMDISELGCDSTTFINRVLATDTLYLDATTCFQSEVGEDMEVFINQFNCDSVVITTTSLLEENITIFESFTCDPAEVIDDTTFLMNIQNCDSIVITRIALLEIELATEINDVECFGDNNGSIIVQSTSGGLSPYLYALNDGAFQDGLIFSGLAADTYTFTVQDANGCETIEEITIETTSDFTIDLGPDTTIVFGETYDLQINSNQDIDTIYWSTVDGLSCNNCLDPTITLENTTTYLVSAINADGCIATDHVTIAVFIDREVFIPSSFSPNGDELNDVFMIYGGPNVTQITAFHIYDRWGECLFANNDFLTDEPSEGWDGKFRNKYMNPAVYVYKVEVEYRDGTSKIITGDVTLMK